MKKMFLAGISLISLIGTFPAKSIGTELKVTSHSIESGKKIKMDHVFSGFGCNGKNQSPHLKWENFPKDKTKYFAITMYDPDAPTGSGWWHWILVNIPANVTEVAAGISGHLEKLPEGSLETRTDFGQPGYGGPCPPEKDKPHHYEIKIYALKDKVPVEAQSSGAMVGFYLHSLKTAEGSLRAVYGR